MVRRKCIIMQAEHFIAESLLRVFCKLRFYRVACADAPLTPPLLHEYNENGPLLLYSGQIPYIAVVLCYLKYNMQKSGFYNFTVRIRKNYLIVKENQNAPLS